MGRRLRRRFWRRVQPAIGWAVFLCLAVAGMKSWVDSRSSNPPYAAAPPPTAFADPAAGPAPAPAAPMDGTAATAGNEVWHCEKCNRDWPAWKLCCWVGTTRVK